MPSTSRLLLYALLAAAACGLVFVLVQLTDNPAWGALPAVFFAAYVAVRGSRCREERRDEPERGA